MGLIDRIRSKFTVAKLDTWIVSGLERRSGQPFSFSFSGSSALKAYQAELAFAGQPTEIHLGALPVSMIDTTIRIRAPQCAVSFVELNEAQAGGARWIRSDMQIPVWMALEIELTGSLDASLRRSRFKNMRKAIAKNGLSCEVRTDDTTFDDFYHRMYLPHIRARHGSAQVAAAYNGLKDRYHHGELIMIKLGDTVVAGSLIDFGYRQPRIMEMGIVDGDERYLKLGVSEAVYWFSFERILAKGGGPASVGNSRAYLRDGALFYKISLGARFAGHYRKTGFVHVHFRRRTAALEGYLGQNPFVAARDGGFYATAFADATSVNGVVEEFHRFDGSGLRCQMFVWPPAAGDGRVDLSKKIPGCDVYPADRILGRRID